MSSSRFHPDTIETIRDRVDIVDVISDSVVLKKRGKDYQGLCPFHEEKTPSFTVSPSKQLYYCFGCGAGGNVFKFLMEVGKQSFSEVVLDLARRYQIEVKTLEPEQQEKLQRELSLREQLYEILAVAGNFYQYILQQPEGKTALEYLQSERNFDQETIKTWGLGYAPQGWETLHRYLVEQKRYPVGLVEQAGLIQPRKSGKGYVDRFRDRAMIPIKDPQGRIIGFGSRTLGDDEPKYLNSPETPLFDKSKTLFALDQARDAIRKEDQAIIVEGYFDAIALHAAAIKPVVASLGTALSKDHIRQLLRYTESKQIIYNFDADQAGITATQRGIKEIEPLVYSGQVQLRVLNLPGGKDADEFLKSHPDAAQQYRQQLETAPFWIDWQIDQLIKDQDLNQPHQVQKVTDEMVKLVNRLQDVTLRTHYIRHCAEILSQGDSQQTPLYLESFRNALKKPQKGKKSSLSQTSSTEKNVQSFPTLSQLLAQAEALLLRVYLHCPGYRSSIFETLEEKELLFSLSPYRWLWQKILELEATYDFSGDHQQKNLLLTQLEDEITQFPEYEKALKSVLQLQETTSTDLQRPGLVVKASIATLEQTNCEKQKRYCLQQWQQLDGNTDQETIDYYMKQFYEAQRQLELLKQQRQFSIQDIISN
ncbi:DNA primase [Dactylococcopsis salina]|uniref:DNA primase n=1 Tax=Dactylococcopsis salina (strain PCC 8305) TaxID=13035 RepID=K9YRG2_DACS8|nr:DNA primase [Dactylococcopsis salina]AFZ49504.1 DNA primase, catalytic core [Dactylococcopsis salina PCC 8305]